MHIYQAEIDAGLTEVLSAKSSIVYASLAEKSESVEPKKRIKENQALAGIEDSDLYYTQSILVTTSWNKNDDIFDPKEVWMAKSTPMHKPTNLEHDESLIVGHITSNWPINEDGELIDDNTSEDQLPEKFHILTGSVIYKGYTEPDLKERAEKLIAEIEDGNKYVSMECFFKGFDYGLTNKSNGEFHVLARNEDTAFLTKHLRAYGGQGEHQDYKIGRVLRQITFSGKGFVNRPANPESIIFTKDNLHFDKQVASAQNIDEKNDDSEKVGVFSNQANLKETIMTDESPEMVEQVVETVATETVETTTVVDNTEALLNAHAELEALKLEKEEAAQKLADKDAECASLKAELDAANEALAGYKMKEEEMAKKEKKMKRMASLIESGIDSETAEATVDKFENLDDDMFASVTSLVASKKTAKVEEETNEVDETDKEQLDEQMKKKASTEADASILETAEVEESVDLSIASDTQDSEIQNTRAALVDFVCIRLGKKLNKGE